MRKFVFVLLILSCISVAGYAGYKLISTGIEYKEGRDVYERVSSKYTKSLKAAPIKKDKTVVKKKSDSLKPPIEIDWDGLKKTNPDVIGWIYVEGVEGISYPVLQAEDNEYYLHRLADGTYNFAGSIFMEAQNSSDFTDPHTILYGHNMQDRSMFGNLREFRENAAYSNSPYFWILTPERSMRYRIFCITTVGDYDRLYTLFPERNSEYKDWLSYVESISIVPLAHEELSTGSTVVTLSTCFGSGDGAKECVIGVLEKTADSDRGGSGR